MGSDYKNMPFPWISKSKLMTYDYCPYNFYINYIKKEKFKTREDAVEGTNMHMVFAKFFDELKDKYKDNPGKIFSDKYTDPRKKVRVHPFRRAIYKACMKFVKPNQREYPKYKNIISNFASIETRRFLRLNSILNNEKKIFEYFCPLYIEKRLEHEPTHLFGTIDRVNAMIMPGGKTRIAIYDYKTGNVPSAVQKRDPNSVDIFDWKLPSSKMKEIHFYGLLYLLANGWKLSDEIMSFLNDEEWFFTRKDGMNYKETRRYKKKYLTSLGDDYKLFKAGKGLLEQGDIIVGYYFLNGGQRIANSNKYRPKAYRPIKEYSTVSHKAVLLAINELRSIWHNKEYRERPLENDQICYYKKCSHQEMCKERRIL